MANFHFRLWTMIMTCEVYRTVLVHIKVLEVLRVHAAKTVFVNVRRKNHPKIALPTLAKGFPYTFQLKVMPFTA